MEVNAAGALSPLLARWPRHVLTTFPEVDIVDLPFATNSFDLVVHSDTLEHVPDPRAGIRECLRVLRPGGWLAYTVPIVVGRLSRRADENNPSYHGTAEDPSYLVVTEYGADAWVELAQEGVTDIRITSYAHPAAHALMARKPRHR